MEPKQKYYIELDLLAKDSVPYHAEIEVPLSVYNEFKRLLKKKGPEDDVFNTNSGKVSAFLKEVDEAFSPKLYRTAIGTKTLVEYLKENRVKKDAPDYEKLAVLKRANLAASTKLNHRSGIGKEKKIDFTKFDTRITALKEQYAQLKKDPKKEAFASRVKERLDKAIMERSLKEDIGDVSLGTALGAYLDPRVIFSWCKDVKFPVDKIYNKKQVEFFSKFADESPTFWRKYP
jgi:hypothetical protein